ncbi:MAG: discoidin domain-containing protein [Lachnospiraceae bacterium]|nr:discoidin domain-containing protein [Lachnospiraceae bacterium]
MKKKEIVIIASMAVVFVALFAFVTISNAAGNPNKDNITVIAAPNQQEAMENDLFKVEEYVSPEIDGTNVAKDGLMTSNGFTDVYPATNANDGTCDAASYWEGPAGETAELTLNMKKKHNIHTVRLGLNPMSIWSKRTQTMSIEVSDDGENFTELVASADYKFDPNTGNEIIIDIPDVETQYVRLLITKNTGATSGQVAEFEVYSND